MFRKRFLKSVACVAVVSYLSVCWASSYAFAESLFTVTPPLLLAQATNPAVADAASAEEGRALRQIYSEKIQRLEAEMNSSKGSRNTLLTTAITSFFIGAGVIAGSTTIRGGIKDIPVDQVNQNDRDKALDAIDAVRGVGGGILGVGGLSMLGYFIYTGIINSKQNRIDTLRAELDTRFEAKGLTPEYLQKNESVAAVITEISDLKKSAGTSRTMQGLFSRMGMGSLLSGGFLVGVSVLTDDIVKKININENDPEEVSSRADAVDKVDSIKTTGYILLGAGAAAEVASFLFGQRAKGKDKRIDEMENSLLRVAERIDIQPSIHGVMVMYSQNF